MKVLSWNILATEWIKRSYYKRVKDEILFDRRKRFKTIFNKICSEDADIIMLQEVMIQEYKALKKLLGSEYWISDMNPIIWKYSAKDNESESGNVTMLKKSTFPRKNYIKHYPLDFGVSTKCVYKRAVLTIFNIHLDDLSGVTRNRQLESVKPHFGKQCIIAGDFNQVYKKGIKLYNLPGFRVHNDCPTYYIEKRMNIDNIITRGLKKVKSRCSDCEYYPRSMEEGFHIYASDHLPIKAHFE